MDTAPSPALLSTSPPPALPPPVLRPKSLQRNLLRHQAHPMKPHIRNGIFQLECAFGLGRTPSSRTKFQVICASRHAVGTVTRVCAPNTTNPGSCWGLWLWVIVQHTPHATRCTENRRNDCSPKMMFSLFSENSSLLLPKTGTAVGGPWEEGSPSQATAASPGLPPSGSV